MTHLLVATRNAHKTHEFAQILGDEFQIRDLSGIENIPVVEETGHTFEENAVIKALAASRNRPEMIVADDSGLEVDALGGAPGIFSARFGGPNATDEKNVDLLLNHLATRRVPAAERSARFRCVIALARNGTLLGTFQGEVEGVIIDKPRGTGGFGYDPVFMPDGFDQTFGEMPPEIKSQISHRAKALFALRDGLRAETDRAETG